MKVHKTKAVNSVDLNSLQAVELFRKAAKAFTKHATRSEESALQTLIKEGIYTKSGKLSKHYR